MEKIEAYRSKNHVRFVTASSLFDGHDASVNIMRRILQSSGAEVIHLGHNRSVEEVVNAAIQEDAQGVALSSYQGGHMEYFKYMYDLLREKGAPHIKIFGGGGGVILPREIKELHEYGIAGIFSPEDGRQLGLQGMVNKKLEGADFSTLKGNYTELLEKCTTNTPEILANLITAAENGDDSQIKAMLEQARKKNKNTPTIGITGTGGAGKSSLTDELIRRFLQEFPDKKLAILSVDPTKQKTGGALLGDRIRMNAIFNNRVYMRSLATRGSRTELSSSIGDVLDVVRAVGFDLILLETSGIGQGDAEITNYTDLSMYVMTSEFGAPTQLEKIDMIDYADLIAINKFERKGSEDALRQVQKQYQRSRELWDQPIDAMPVYGTIASQFNDLGTNSLFAALVAKINEKFDLNWESSYEQFIKTQKQNVIIPNDRRYYLREISESVRNYHKQAEQQATLATKLYQLEGTKAQLPTSEQALIASIDSLIEGVQNELSAQSKQILKNWIQLKEAYSGDELITKVRDKEIKTILKTTSLSGLKIPKVALPNFKDYGEILRFVYSENVPGEFPYTAGVFPFKREGEDPKRQFAGEGTPERTNKRFHYLSKDDNAKRLSTAFDSVTLYGEDPHIRPDIYGKVGESGVSICTLEDMKKLYAGFDLCAPSTSVSMTINGPAPIILAMFMNTAIDQQVKKREQELGRTLTMEEFTETREMTLQVVRGTVQADILKEDQGQNTCIFSTEFALRMMGDIQQYFIDHQVRNYYSVSISGYHIAEAGANPISQLAFTLANGFTYVEYYLSRGMQIDDFAPNLSFFFSNGLDPEYTVIGRVARRIWAVTMRDKYGANERSQKLKYHIQTSGRSLHAQEIDFNDIRTTLQALMALQDNCNSLHTNAYDEAITTPTEESVRRAMAIQMIITKEHGLSKNENPLQGAFIVEELTQLVERAVLEEFDRINDRGGVLGAMETQYQRGKIQEESMYYEHLKHSGELPIIGVNTYLNPNPTSDDAIDNMQIARASKLEKDLQIENLEKFKQVHETSHEQAIQQLKEVAKTGGNIFEALMETVKVASLGQITQALYEVGGQYRRNM
ncbi:methylmalonyl-CoA mutase [Lysinibacillus sp. 2017]|uniref:fused isobutyryl-CoA mutase/GTPase IcmF n=1 Tax=unclassified Lysinibacillus TaxID=2636778 RepID=UPI000D52901C|nr:MULTISPECIES: fused isobutyryl-CoA mutase/GTPase IcmF [unclassified Lysinibacillus]AWE06277.1 methylmalonyl-CoA mutase [Lysinibacillus sp. 2017]TGN35247.1 methylmalonyl-CoA mutase [Lysinibacillus sp. S2017]